MRSREVLKRTLSAATAVQEIFDDPCCGKSLAQLCWIAQRAEWAAYRTLTVFQPWFVYLLYCSETDKTRVIHAQHLVKKYSTYQGYTWKLLYKETFDNSVLANRRARYIRRLSSARRFKLIEKESKYDSRRSIQQNLGS